MKILHAISNMDPVSGGPIRVLADLTRYQVLAGHQVTVCTSDRGNPTSKILGAGVIAPLLSGVDLRCFAVDFAPMLVSRTMGRWIRQNIRQFDIVHVHGLYRFPSTYVAYQARKQGVPYVIRPHGSIDPYMYRQSSRSVLLKRLYERWFDLPNLNAASAIHYTAKDERQCAAFLNLRAPSFVVPNGLSWDHYAKLPERGAFRERLGIGDAPLVLFLGRLNFKKGLDLLVPAFARVRERHPEARLAIIGPDNEGYGAKVRDWVSKYELNRAVHFVDYLHGDDVMQAYVDADVFALPSYTENFGMTVAESLACGTPVVISDQVNIHHEVAAAGAGLVTHCDVTEVAEALDVLLCDAPRRQAIGAAGRALVQRKWTWEVVACDLLVEYEKVIERSKAKNKTTANLVDVKR